MFRGWDLFVIGFVRGAIVGYTFGGREATQECGEFVARVFEQCRRLPHRSYSSTISPHLELE